VPGTRRAVVRLYRSTGIDAIGPYTERLRGFTGDALVVFGDADAFIGVEQADEQRRIFANSRLEIVPGAGHWPWLERPELVIPLVTEFLREQLAATGRGT
jgi:pimeloyl-ACP methyl ester carboxylesterase